MIRLRYWQNPETGEERVYLGGLGTTVWCDANGIWSFCPAYFDKRPINCTPAGTLLHHRHEVAIISLWQRGLALDYYPALPPTKSVGPIYNLPLRDPGEGGWIPTWKKIVRVARREHNYRLAQRRAAVRAFDRARRRGIIAGRAWLRLCWWWRGTLAGGAA